MSYEKFEYGPLRTYEIVWKSGHVETVQGHQVLFTGGDADMDVLGSIGRLQVRTNRDPRFTIHGEFDGHWRLVLSGLESDLATLRDVTTPERAS